jgi:hypothetical protein
VGSLKRVFLGAIRSPTTKRFNRATSGRGSFPITTGVNLAVQDAVASANILAAPLRANQLELHHLAKVQSRRLLPTRIIQWLQLAVQNNVIAPTLSARTLSRPPLPARLLARCPLLRRLPARLVGLGIRPEHVSEEIRRGAAARQGKGPKADPGS